METLSQLASTFKELERVHTAKKLLSLITKPEPKPETPLQHTLKQGLKQWNENRGNCNASFLYPDKDTPPKSKVIPEEVFDEMMLGGLK
jgi:hypothetical protein